jgi:hypothetical protein
MTTIYIDIETIPAPIADREFMRPDPAMVKLGNIKDQAKAEEKIAKAITEWESGATAALDSLQANIALIGLAVEDGPVKHFDNQDGEDAMLAEFWQEVSSCCASPGDVEIVGHNIRFDASMIVHRSWITGAGVNKYLVADLYGKSPRHWRDTMIVWQLGDYKADYRKLRDICGAFGITVKSSPVQAHEFWKWWEKDKDACREYNAEDIMAVRSLWSKIGK